MSCLIKTKLHVVSFFMTNNNTFKAHYLHVGIKSINPAGHISLLAFFLLYIFFNLKITVSPKNAVFHLPSSNTSVPLTT